MQFPLVEGTTEPQVFTFRADGVVVNLTGVTSVELVLVGRDGVAVDTSADVAVTDAPNGKVAYTPDPADLLAAMSPYSLHFKVTSGG